MAVLRLKALNSKLPLDEQQILGWVAFYRWLAIIPPTITLLTSISSEPELSGAFYGLALVNLILQTLLYFYFKSVTQKKTSNGGLVLLPARPYILTLIVFELLVDALLNNIGGVWSSPYYLYSLTGIFQCAFFFGLRGATISTLILGASYLAGLIAGLWLGGMNGNWLTPVVNLTLLVVTATLFAYMTVVSRLLRHHSATLERYRSSFDYQHQALEQANRRLDKLAHFNRVLQEGSSPTQIEQMALQYLGRFLDSSRTFEGQRNTPGQEVLLLKGAVAREWLNSVAPEIAEPVQALWRPGSEVLPVEKNNRVYWLVPLIYKREQFGVLAVPKQSDGAETEQRVLLSLLAEQMARMLGSLKQNQALAVEAERARLAMDMHDVVAQSLFGIALNLSGCLKIMDKNPQEARTRLGDLQALAYDTLGSVRAIIYDLWNEESGSTDFVELVQSYLKKAGKLYPFEIFLEIKGQDFMLEREAQKSLYRILQEGLANAVKHSGAKQVRLTISRTQTEIELGISDNGRGFDPSQSRQKTESGGMGLPNIRERLEQLNGSLKIESAPGAGTKLVARLPLSQLSESAHR